MKLEKNHTHFILVDSLATEGGHDIAETCNFRFNVSAAENPDFLFRGPVSCRRLHAPASCC